MNKKQRLLRLRSRIIDIIFKKRWEDVWFFPKYKGVNGYLGTQNIIFLTINPSTGVFPSWYDRQYYRQLKKQGFANAHLTDVFKQRGQARNWKKLIKKRKLVDEAKKFLLAEIKIIRPKLIVLMGKTYKKFYEDILKNVGVEKMSISHYAFRYKNKKKLRKIIREEIQGVRDKYLTL